MFFKIAVLITGLGAAAAAQSSNGYIFAAPGAVMGSGSLATLHFGGGVDLPLLKGFGPTIELGAIGPVEEYSTARGMFSPGVTFYPRRGKELRIEPFVSGGYTLMFRYANESLGFFGGGTNIWLARKVGLRLEVRDHVSKAYWTTLHYWGIRMGLAFR